MISKSALKSNVSIIRRHAETINWYLRKAGWQDTFLDRSAEKRPFTAEERIEALETARAAAVRLRRDATLVADQAIAYCDYTISELRRQQ